MHKIMIVDDNMTNLIMAKKALEGIYEIVPVNSGETALEFLRDMPEPPDLLLLDVDMPKVNGFYVISEMKNNSKLASIPVIFLTAQDDDTTEVEGFFLGAVDYIRKPYTTALLRKKLDIHVRILDNERQLKSVNNTLSQTIKEKTHNIVELQYAIVEMFVDLMARRDITVSEHASRVEKYMDVFLAEVIKSGKYDIFAEDAEMFIFASKIHDIGKICLSDRALLTPVSDLSLQEVEEMKSHTT
ncbi:MAG: response regulator, partial [Clostridia bacterium]|nr:response regulator [Clostridia bacterium]